MYICHLLIFVGCYLVLYVQGQNICKKDQYTILKSDGSFKRCLNCLTCHPGRGLYPPCGKRIPDPPHPDCITCPAGTFSDELDSAPCQSCQRCAEHELVTAPCTNKSNRICSGTCEVGYFYSKKDSTHSCQKCAYCCFDDKDEEILECASQGFNASKQHCRPRPDKDCSPGSSTVISPTIHTTGTEASRNGSSISVGLIGGVIGGVGIVFVVVITLCLYVFRRKKTRGVSEEGNGKASYSCAERQDDSNSGGDLHENTTSNEANQNATHSSSPSGRNYRSVSDASAENVAFVIDNTSDRMSGGDPEAAVKLTALKEEDEAGDLKDITSDGLLRKLRRQFSKDSHGSCGDSADPEVGRSKRSPSIASLAAMGEALKRRLSPPNIFQKEERLVGNEEQGEHALISECWESTGKHFPDFQHHLARGGLRIITSENSI